MWALAPRIEYLYYEIDDHGRVLKAVLDQVTHSCSLLAERGVAISQS